MARTRAVQTSPGLRLADWALIAAFLGLTFLLGVFPLKDTDFWWHLRTGDWIRQTGWVPTHDLYTYTAADHPWIDLHWAFEVALSWGYQLGGIEGLNLVKCVVTCAAMLLLVTARRRDWPVWVMLLAWLPALIVLSGRMYLRPETVSLLYLSVYLAILFRWEERPRWVFALPVVQVLWVNTQGLFVLGPIVLAAALFDAAVRPGAFARDRRGWWKIVGIATGLTGLACLVNPYGLLGVLFPFELVQTMKSPVFRQNIAELTPIPEFIRRSAGLGNFSLQMVLVTLGLGALSFLVPLVWRVLSRRPLAPETPRAKGKKGKGTSKGQSKSARAAQPREEFWRLSLFRLLLFTAFSYLGFQATRNSHQFAAVVGTITAWNLGEWAAALQRRRVEAGRRSDSVGTGGLAPRLLTAGAIGLTVAAVASGGLYRLADEGRTIGLGEEPLWFPHQAIAFAGRDDLPPRFLSFHDGHAALYDYVNGPKRKVFVDARLEVIGPELYERYNHIRDQISQGDPGWEEALEEAGRPVILTDHVFAYRVGVTLLASPAWRCVWFDPIALVFAHEADAGPAGVQAVDFAARHYHPDPATEPAGVPALLAAAQALGKYALALPEQGRLAQASASQGLGGLAVERYIAMLRAKARPLALLGLDYARRAIRSAPDQADGWTALALLDAARLPAPDSSATPQLGRPLEPVADLPWARVLYDGRQALKRQPKNTLILDLLARTYESRGLAESALAMLDRLALQPPKTQRQADAFALIDARRSALRGRLGPEPTTVVRPNASELERAILARLDSGRAESAAELLEQSTPTGPRPWPIADRLATLWLLLGEPARARAAWQSAASPPRPALRSARVALTYLVAGEFDLARQSYHEALSAEPNLFEAHYGLACLEDDTGHAAAALTSALQAVAHAPDPSSRSAAQTIAEAAEPYAEVPARRKGT